jgi:hypothetical protein
MRHKHQGMCYNLKAWIPIKIAERFVSGSCLVYLEVEITERDTRNGVEPLRCPACVFISSITSSLSSCRTLSYDFDFKR